MGAHHKYAEYTHIPAPADRFAKPDQEIGAAGLGRIAVMGVLAPIDRTKDQL
jgi:hypothetical protein